MAKGKRRRGRPRQIVERQPNGQPRRSRAKEAEEARSVAVEARQRVFRLTAKEAALEEAGSVLGRLSRSGELHPHPPMARALYEAGKHFEQVKRDYLTAIHAKRQLAGGDIDRGPAGFDHDEGNDGRYVELCERRIDAWKDMRRVLLEADGLAMMACECVIGEDKYAASLIGPLRCGLNAIARMIRREGRAA